jgi:hypothetical protein
MKTEILFPILMVSACAYVGDENIMGSATVTKTNRAGVVTATFVWTNTGNQKLCFVWPETISRGKSLGTSLRYAGMQRFPDHELGGADVDASSIELMPRTLVVRALEPNEFLTVSKEVHSKEYVSSRISEIRPGDFDPNAEYSISSQIYLTSCLFSPAGTQIGNPIGPASGVEVFSDAVLSSGSTMFQF